MKSPPARVFRGTARNVAFLARQLRAGELVAAPTETVYGLAANALDADACAKIFTAKGRPTHDPLIVHIHSLAQLSTLAEVNASALKLARAFWPGALTLVLPKKAIVPDIVTAGRDSVAVRMPSHPLFRCLLKQAGIPLAAPSANPFGYVSPTTAAHVQQSLAGRIRFILDGGPARIGLESTIIDLRDPAKPALLRPGAITSAELTRVLGRRVASPQRTKQSHRSKPTAQLAPGLLARHYSPRTPVVLHRTLSPALVRAIPPDEAVVFLARPRARTPAANVFWLDARGDLSGVGRRLFATLRKLDTSAFRRIHIELAPETGLGQAINDRLRRAAA